MQSFSPPDNKSINSHSLLNVSTDKYLIFSFLHLHIIIGVFDLVSRASRERKEEKEEETKIYKNSYPRSTKKINKTDKPQTDLFVQ